MPSLREPALARGGEPEAVGAVRPARAPASGSRRCRHRPLPRGGRSRPSPCAMPARADSLAARTAPVRNATPISDSRRCATSRSARRKYRCRPWLSTATRPRVDELREMRADRLLRHARHAGELGRGQRPVRHQRGEHFRPGVIADQRGDADDVRSVFHGSIVDRTILSAQGLSSPASTPRQDSPWPSPASSATRSIRSSATRSRSTPRTGAASSRAAAAS